MVTKLIQEQAQQERLKYLLNWLLPISLALGVIEIVAAIISRSIAIGICGAASLCFVLSLLYSKWMITHGQRQPAVVTIAIGLFLADTVASVAFPAFLPVLVLIPVLAIVVVLPYAASNTLRGLCIAAWSVSTVIALIARSINIFPSPPPSATGVLIVVEVTVGAALILVLLWQFHSNTTQEPQTPTLTNSSNDTLLHGVTTANTQATEQ